MANTNKLIKPKWELYDVSNNPEAELYEDYIVEFTDIAGIAIDYYVSMYDDIDADQLYGEPEYQNLYYHNPKRSKMIYEVTEEPKLISTFGMYSEDVLMFGMMPKFTFTRDVSASRDPKPGDVIKTLWNDRAYEVVDVGAETHIFQLHKKVWEFVLKPYRFSEESDSAISISPDLDSTLTNPSSAYSDNEWIEDTSDDMESYSNVDTSVYGY